MRESCPSVAQGATRVRRAGGGQSWRLPGEAGQRAGGRYQLSGERSLCPHGLPRSTPGTTLGCLLLRGIALKDTGWPVELGLGLCEDFWVSGTGWHPHAQARAAEPWAATSSEPPPGWLPEGIRQAELPPHAPNTSALGATGHFQTSQSCSASLGVCVHFPPATAPFPRPTWWPPTLRAQRTATPVLVHLRKAPGQEHSPQHYM